jgi:ribosomal protein L11 methyltransferase
MSAEAWIEVRAIVPNGWEELIATLLTQAGCQGAREGTSTAHPPKLPPNHNLVRSHYPETSDSPAHRQRLTNQIAALAHIDPELATTTIAFRPLPPEDYAKTWKKVWHPFRCGNLAVVAPSTQTPLRPTDIRLELEPGGVFGTGRHATTRMILRFLQDHLTGGERVLDCGTGTGILAVAARLLGASQAHGFDTDQGSAAAANNLAQRNQVATNTNFLEGDFTCLTQLSPPYDIVLANLYSDLLITHAPQLAAATKPNGWLCVSGLNATRQEAVTTALTAQGLTITAQRSRGIWRALLATRE